MKYTSSTRLLRQEGLCERDMPGGIARSLLRECTAAAQLSVAENLEDDA
jgi:hypothetical protein